MFDKLEQLRKKPDHVKKLIALGAALCITGVIFVFWFVSFTVSTQAELAQSQGQGQGQGQEQFDSSGSIVASPFAALKANVVDSVAPAAGAFGDSFNKLVGYFSGATGEAGAGAATGAGDGPASSSTPE
jgi:cytoskeletal protein RodZ